MEQLVIDRKDLGKEPIDIKGRDLIIGFSEPAFRDDLEKDGMLGAPLNARLFSYFLPAVQIARTQKSKRRPRLIVVSGIRAAIKWNAKTEEERITMTINNNLKKEFIASAFKTFFPEVFSLVEIRTTTDFLKISDEELKQLWQLFQAKYPEKLREIETQLRHFRQDTHSSEPLFRYALAHLFAMCDINFDWEPYNPHGYCSIGEHNETIFNEVRNLGFSILKDSANFSQNREVHFFENMKIVIDDDEKTPPPYNGAHRSAHGKTQLDEVTFENARSLDHYDSRPRLKPSMDYIYSLVGRQAYENFWMGYREQYLQMKARYEEAYGGGIC